MDNQENINNVLRRFTKTRLDPASNDVLILDADTAQSPLNRSANYCYGKIHAAPNFNFRTLQTILDHPWNKTKFRVSWIRDGLLQFFFQSKKEMEAILECTPWNIENHLLILVSGSTNQLPFPSDFDWVEYWIHFWGLFGIMRVKINILKPLKKCMSIQVSRSLFYSGALCYERLPTFCYDAGE